MIENRGLMVVDANDRSAATATIDGETSSKRAYGVHTVRAPDLASVLDNAFPAASNPPTAVARPSRQWLADTAAAASDTCVHSRSISRSLPELGAATRTPSSR